MKPNPIFVAAAGFAMVGACSVTTDNAAEKAAGNGDESSATTNQGNVLPATDAGTQADTLGNQLNQLDADATNQTSSAASNQQ
jgi:hypothetical protein